MDIDHPDSVESTAAGDLQTVEPLPGAQERVVGKSAAESASPLPTPAFTGDDPMALSTSGSLSGDASDSPYNQGQWLVQAAWRLGRSNADRSPSITCFVGGVADGTSEETLIAAASQKGVRIRKCHVLPKVKGFSGSVAFKVFLHSDDIDRATSDRFWPRGIWCRRWRPKTSKEAQ